MNGNQMQKEVGGPGTSVIERLSHELLQEIAAHLHPKDLVMLASSSRCLRDALGDNFIWYEKVRIESLHDVETKRCPTCRLLHPVYKYKKEDDDDSSDDEEAGIPEEEADPWYQNIFEEPRLEAESSWIDTFHRLQKNREDFRWFPRYAGCRFNPEFLAYDPKVDYREIVVNYLSGCFWGKLKPVRCQFCFRTVMEAKSWVNRLFFDAGYSRPSAHIRACWDCQREHTICLPVEMEYYMDFVYIGDLRRLKSSRPPPAHSVAGGEDCPTYTYLAKDVQKAIEDACRRPAEEVARQWNDYEDCRGDMLDKRFKIDLDIALETLKSRTDFAFVDAEYARKYLTDEYCVLRPLLLSSFDDDDKLSEAKFIRKRMTEAIPPRFEEDINIVKEIYLDCESWGEILEPAARARGSAGVKFAEHLLDIYMCVPADYTVERRDGYRFSVRTSDRLPPLVRGIWDICASKFSPEQEGRVGQCKHCERKSFYTPLLYAIHVYRQHRAEFPEKGCMSWREPNPNDDKTIAKIEVEEDLPMYTTFLCHWSEDDEKMVLDVCKSRIKLVPLPWELWQRGFERPSYPCSRPP